MPSGLVPLVECLDGHSRHVTLTYAKPLGLKQKNWGVGVDLLEVYIQVRTRRVFLHTYSRLEDPGHLGRAKGDTWTEADNLMITKLAKEFEPQDGELRALLPITEEEALEEGQENQPL